MCGGYGCSYTDYWGGCTYPGRHNGVCYQELKEAARERYDELQEKLYNLYAEDDELDDALHDNTICGEQRLRLQEEALKISADIKELEQELEEIDLDF